MSTRFKRRSLHKSIPVVGQPKYIAGDTVGDFEILRYMGHSLINKRNSSCMSKAQHWYRCICTCGTEESRSQQELIDPRRQQKCYVCRTSINLPEKELS